MNYMLELLSSVFAKKMNRILPVAINEHRIISLKNANIANNGNRRVNLIGNASVRPLFVAEEAISGPDCIVR